MLSQILMKLVLCLLTLFNLCRGQACPDTIPALSNIQPKVAAGWNYSLAAGSLKTPRSIIFDPTGKLLVLQAGFGIIAITLADSGGHCVVEKDRFNVVRDTSLNHGLALTEDGKRLYASNEDTVYVWNYDASKATVTNRRVLVKGMANNDHSTRTLLISEFLPYMLFVSRGSNSNIDPGAGILANGRSQIRAFDVNAVPSGGYNYTNSGLRLGYGLRNSVGIAEHPGTGGIYSVENSADDMKRNGIDVHQNNPGEEMNFHGTLIDNQSPVQGSNFGYPDCFSVWNASSIPKSSSDPYVLKTGTAFSNSSSFDSLCPGTTPPVLTFEAHMAPLDIKFNNSGLEAWVTYHGSWDRSIPAGYKVSVIAFTEDGNPVPASDSMTSITDIMTNGNQASCPGSCFRPVGMAFDKGGRLFVSSDSTNEIYVLAKN